MIRLPPELASAIAAELAPFSARELERAASELSRRYRDERDGDAARFVRDDSDALGYVAQVLPATHAQLVGALSMVPLRAGAWTPRSLLDLGAGPGTAAWAASALWPSIESVVEVEREAAFLALGSRLARASPREAVRGARWVQADLAGGDLRGLRADLVVLSHVLPELSDAGRARALDAAWAACDGVLVVVHAGTPAAFDVLRWTRDRLVRAGARLLAPCPHEGPCPMPPADWCHFPQRTERPAFQRRVKHATLGYEDAKFSFVAAARFPSAAPPWGRVVHDPQRPKGRVLLQACSADGLVVRTVPKSAGEAYRAAKQLEWGSALAADPADLR